jgi:hypothetical protein
MWLSGGRHLAVLLDDPAWLPVDLLLQQLCELPYADVQVRFGGLTCTEEGTLLGTCAQSPPVLKVWRWSGPVLNLVSVVGHTAGSTTGIPVAPGLRAGAYEKGGH